MGRVVITEFITLDGVIEDPGGSEGTEHAGWSFKFNRGEDGDRFKTDELIASDAQLLGRVTYEGFAAAWPNMNDTGGFGERMNSMPKYVVSSTLTDEAADWENSTVLRGDWAGEVGRLKDEIAGDILVAGSAQLVRGLGEAGLIDEYRLMLFPVILGSGKRLFEGPLAHTTLRLVAQTPVGPDGVTILTYAPAG
jgi:dihydrofolate reductase